MASYIIHSGWWCDGSTVHPGATKYSDPRIRTVAFHEVWYEFVKKYTNPEKVIIVDSAAPVQPDLTGKDIQFLSLKRNFLHGMTCDTKFCGASRAILTGAFYSFINDADYSVFIEQDCLVYGEGIIERGIAELQSTGKQISFTLGGPNRSDQSLMIIDRNYFMKFLNAYLAIQQNDREMDTEDKFLQIIKEHDSFTPLPYGYGRNRPINFKDEMITAQQWRPNELAQLFYKTESPALRELLQYDDSVKLKLDRFVRRVTGR
jgi:hypothetical protein